MESILILGNPNSGKSLLFNKLTGSNQKVANFPGVTVDISKGRGLGILSPFELVDFPGIYSFDPLTRDESVALEHLQISLEKTKTKVLLYVVDATRLERSLYLLLQVQARIRASGLPVRLVAALNVIDELINKKLKIDREALEKDLGIPCCDVSAKTGLGLEVLRQRVLDVAQAATVASAPTELKNDTTVLKNEAKRLASEYGPRGDVLLKSQNRLDHFLLSGFWGPVVFVAVSVLLFQSIFTWASPLMELISSAVEWTGSHLSSLASAPMLQDFIKDGLLAGIGAFLVFVPQIFILFLIIGALEDSGYLARAAVICHRPLSFFGLSGKSFVPLLSGYACAIPAMMATRTIESPKKRLLTLLIIPLMTCSARLPVYGLLIATFIPAHNILGGLIGLQGFVFFVLYIMGLVVGLLASGLISRMIRKSAIQDAPFIIEMPPYRVPSLRPILKQSFGRTKDFIKRAGGVIFAVSLVIWILGYFPHGSGHLDTSWLGYLGHWIEPIVRPLGLDWKFGIAILTSFLAREVFVGTLGTLYGLEEAKEHMASLGERLHGAGVTMASGIALLVFYALAMQCLATLAVLRKETGSNKIPVLVFIGYTILAYAASFVAYRIFV